MGNQFSLADEPRPFDCYDVLLSYPEARNGVYKIYPFGDEPICAFCDMETEGGGWTVRLSNQPWSCRCSFHLLLQYLLTNQQLDQRLNPPVKK